jgi:branched-chain amino acid transport system permease protein
MSETARFIQMLSDGLGNGAVYALLAVGFVVIYKSTKVISFAQLRPLVGRPPFIAAIVTLGVDIVVRNIANRFIGANPRQINDPFGFNAFDVGGAAVQHRDVAAFVVGLVVFGLLFAFFKYTRIGLAMRAAAFDQEVALAQGISVGAVFAISWALAAALAALAGTFLTADAGVEQSSFVDAFKALPAIILGGLDSIGGALIGGLAVGLVEAAFNTYQGDGAGQYLAFLGNNFASVSSYLLMLLVLMVKPYGLFGTPEIERV